MNINVKACKENYNWMYGNNNAITHVMSRLTGAEVVDATCCAQ